MPGPSYYEQSFTAWHRGASENLIELVHGDDSKLAAAKEFVRREIAAAITPREKILALAISHAIDLVEVLIDQESEP